VAEERDGIAAEPPIDVEKGAANWQLDGTLVALVAGEVVGEVRVEQSSFGGRTPAGPAGRPEPRRPLRSQEGGGS